MAFGVKERVIHYSGATVPDLHGIPYSLLPFGRGQKHHTITDVANIRDFFKVRNVCPNIFFVGLHTKCFAN